MRLILLILLFPLFLQSQVCNTCYGEVKGITANPTGTAPYTYLWTCSDGTTSTNPTHYTDSLFESVECVVDITDVNECTVSASVTIIPTIEPILVIQNNSCSISWQNQNLNGNTCSGFILERSINSGSTWTTVSSSLPFAVSVNGLYRVKYTCDCGIYYSNEISVSSGCSCSPFQIADGGDCLWFISSVFPCNDEDYTLWQSINNSIVCSPTACNGASFTALYSTDDGFGFVNNDGCYYVTTSCGGIDYCSNIICISSDCNVGCSGAIAASQDDCDLDVTWALCTTNAYSLQYKVGSSWVNYSSGVSSPPTTFAIPFNGIWRVTQSCTDGCTYNSAQFTFTECGCNNDTQVTILQQPNPCASSVILAASVSQCGSGFTPSFAWSNGATTQSITVSTGTYTVTVSSCCESTNSTKIVTCANPCEDYNVLIEGVITMCNDVETILTGNTLDGFAPYTYSWLVNGVPYATTQNIGIDGADYAPGYIIITLSATDANGCTDNDTHTILITDCSDECDCTPVLSLDEAECELTYYSNNCDGFDIFLQRFISGVWTNVVTDPDNPYIPLVDGQYRIKEISVSCGTYYSNVVNVGCTECILIGDLETGSQCGRTNISAIHNGLGTVNISFAYPTVDVDDCDDAGGWVNFEPESWSWSPSGLSGYVDVFEHCGKCIRVIFDDGAGECDPDDAYILVPCCCEGDFSVDSTSETNEYVQTIQGTYEEFTQPSMFKVKQGTGQITQLYVETEIEENGSPFDTETYSLNIPMFSVHTMALGGTTDCMVELKFKVNTTTHTLDLDPTTTPYLTGSFGTVTAAHLRPKNGATFTQAVTAMKTLLLNAIKTAVPLITVNDLYVGSLIINKASPTFADNIVVAIKPKWNSTTWINDGDFDLIKSNEDVFSEINNSNAYLINSDDCTNLSGIPTSSQYQVNLDYETNCGEIEQLSPTIISYWSTPFCTQAVFFGSGLYQKSLLNNCIYQSCPLYSSVEIFEDFEVWSVLDAGDGSEIMESIECSLYTLTVDSPCSGATYLWSTGQTTASIMVTDGSYSVIMTCDDDCEYILNITVP